MKKPSLVMAIFAALLLGGSALAQVNPPNTIRGVVDTVGFAHLAWQMDSIVTRMHALNQEQLIHATQPAGTVWKTAICPHDDYTYAGWLYEAVLKNLTAKTVILFGVAHKARLFHLENRLVFDSYPAWHGPYGPVKVSPLREQIFSQMPEEMVVRHDSMQTVEHSVEALIPFLQHQKRDVEIVSILVPYMPLDRMESIGQELATVLAAIMAEQHLRWGEDIALVISSDAVHYGDEDWGGSNYAPYGTDSAGNAQAVAHEHEIIESCFTGDLSREQIARFVEYTVSPDNYKDYRWTWCGRYAIPLGLMTALHLQALEQGSPLTGVPVGYATSITQSQIKVDDLRMGRTGIATPRHWVGYPAIGFK